MLAVTRFRVAPDAATSFTARAERAVNALAGLEGFETARLGRSLDDPGLWVLATTWRDVGSYRRGLSSTRAKTEAWALFEEALDEPSAYEVVLGVP